MKKNKKLDSVSTFLLLKPDQRPAGKEIWRFTEWDIPFALGTLLALLIFWPLLHAYPHLNDVILYAIYLGCFGVACIAVMFYRKR